MDSTESTVRSYANRLMPFVVWCEERQIETVDELSGWTLDEYRRSLTNDAPVTVKGKMMALKQLLGYLGRVDAVPVELEEKVPIPQLSAEDERSEVKLAPEDAIAAIRHHRDSVGYVGTARHAMLEVLWFTGCRMSGVRALDLDDYESDTGTLPFVNRPQTGTRLKNGNDGERPDKRDDHGRRPLFSTRQGRASDSSIRGYCYMATQPCLYKSCPHGKNRETCKYRDRTFASQCPSSRSPHQIRTGSITWQLNRGMPIEDVAERVNSAPSTIRRHYDVASGLEKLEERRRDHLGQLSISDNE